MAFVHLLKNNVEVSHLAAKRGAVRQIPLAARHLHGVVAVFVGPQDLGAVRRALLNQEVDKILRIPVDVRIDDRLAIALYSLLRGWFPSRGTASLRWSAQLRMCVVLIIVVLWSDPLRGHSNGIFTKKILRVAEGLAGCHLCD